MKANYYKRLLQHSTRCLLLICCHQISIAQKCEQFDRKLFHFLPKYVPDTINCIDILGKKQGWWLYYKIEYQSTPSTDPEDLDSGNYVTSYIYGKYQDSRKIGSWINFQNKSMCYKVQVDSYYYSKDTVQVLSTPLAKGKTIVQYIHDSSIINYFYISSKDTTDCVICDFQISNTKFLKLPQTVCSRIYKGKIVERFSYSFFEKWYIKPYFLHYDEDDTNKH